jgi:hypothetical protein
MKSSSLPQRVYRGGPLLFSFKIDTVPQLKCFNSSKNETPNPLVSSNGLHDHLAYFYSLPWKTLEDFFAKEGGVCVGHSILYRYDNLQ